MSNPQAHAVRWSFPAPGAAHAEHEVQLCPHRGHEHQILPIAALPAQLCNSPKTQPATRAQPLSGGSSGEDPMLRVAAAPRSWAGTGTLT